MEPQKCTQLVTRLLEEATRMQTVLEQAIATKEREAAHIEASGHITDDEPTPTPVYTLEEQYDAWEKIARALSDIQTELHQIAQLEHQRLERGTPNAARSHPAGRDISVMINDGGSMPRALFTLADAQRWIGRTVITKTAFEAGQRTLEAEQQGTVIGVHGEHTAEGDPILCLAVQFWPEAQDALPEVCFFDKQVFDEYLCLSHTVESPASA
jgi:hypothetical protein